MTLIEISNTPIFLWYGKNNTPDITLFVLVNKFGRAKSNGRI